MKAGKIRGTGCIFIKASFQHGVGTPENDVRLFNELL